MKKNNQERLAHNISSKPEAKTASGLPESLIDSDLINHPTIQAIKELTGYMPKKVLWDRLVKTFPDGILMDKARNALERWTAKGWNPLNLDWLFNWYRSGYYYEHPKDNQRWDEIQHPESDE
jgi:hypothetical protein